MVLPHHRHSGRIFFLFFPSSSYFTVLFLLAQFILCSHYNWNCKILSKNYHPFFLQKPSPQTPAHFIPIFVKEGSVCSKYSKYLRKSRIIEEGLALSNLAPRKVGPFFGLCINLFQTFFKHLKLINLPLFLSTGRFKKSV